MAFPKRGTRRLVVRGATFFWHVSPKREEYGGVATIGVEGGKGLLHYWPSDGFPSPREDAEIISAALDQGWSPERDIEPRWVERRADGMLLTTIRTGGPTIRPNDPEALVIIAFEQGVLVFAASERADVPSDRAAHDDEAVTRSDRIVVAMPYQRGTAKVRLTCDATIERAAWDRVIETTLEADGSGLRVAATMNTREAASVPMEAGDDRVTVALRSIGEPDAGGLVEVLFVAERLARPDARKVETNRSAPR